MLKLTILLVLKLDYHLLFQFTISFQKIYMSDSLPFSLSSCLNKSPSIWKIHVVIELKHGKGKIVVKQAYNKKGKGEFIQGRWVNGCRDRNIMA